MKKFLAGALVASMLLAGAGAAMAVPGGMPAGQAPDTSGASMVMQVHGCHRGAQDGLGGWHRHIGPSCRRVDSSPDWRDPYSRCRTKCRYVGPIKQCRRVCD